MRIRKNLDLCDRLELTDLIIKFLSEKQIIVISQMIEGGFDLHDFLSNDITLEQVIESIDGLNE